MAYYLPTKFIYIGFIFLLCLSLSAYMFFYSNIHFSDDEKCSFEFREIDSKNSDLSDDEKCYRRFSSYIPSTFERLWLDNVEKWQNEPVFCTQIIEQSSILQQYLSIIKHVLMNGSMNYPRTIEEAQSIKPFTHIFSYFEYEIICEETIKTKYVSWIEPLVAGLRHPFSQCSIPNIPEPMLSREYIVLDYIPPSLLYDNVYYLDIGASAYDTGAGGPSQKWFVQNYAQHRNMSFNRIILWEGTPQNMEKLLKHIPDEILPFYQYYNIFADTNTSSPRSPLNLLKKQLEITTHNYVMFKLDMDHPTEFEFIQQILNDTHLSAQIDEFFFEHHVDFAPFARVWKTGMSAMHLSDSYHYFLRLRQKGIRAHGWP